MAKVRTCALEIVELPIEHIKPYPQNPKLHPEKQLAMLEASFRRFGMINPVLVAPDGELIAGHARHLAAMRLGLVSIPAVILPHLSEAEQKAYRIADNRISDKGEWSVELLSREIKLIRTLEVGISPIELGFETPEMDEVLFGTDQGDASVEQVPEPHRNSPATCRPGDVFTFGDKHRIGCLDAKQRSSFELLLDRECARAVISDQPWNLPASFISGRGKTKHPDFHECAGEMTREEFLAFTKGVLRNQASCCAPGTLIYQFIDWRSVDVMLEAGKNEVGELVNICVWAKQSGRLGSPYRSQHELVCVFRVPGGKTKDNVCLGKYGRNRTNLWRYDAPSAFGNGHAELKSHPTAKNVSMISDAILDCTDEGDVVLDAFLGSGTTVLAADRVGRRGFGMEIDPWYADLAIRRLSEQMGVDPIHSSGMVWSDLKASRQEGGL
ncbi:MULTISPECIES: site-specific DNA-methyltransferase [Sphingomonas]|uniref:site-specific DNA-methyltransferase n=1 Tax=Sphingomonas TaxID=13687 RepID=UPI000DEFAC16|nr:MULTISPECIES: DNA methyltransferase [Sphingomonas]